MTIRRVEPSLLAAQIGGVSGTNARLRRAGGVGAKTSFRRAGERGLANCV